MDLQAESVAPPSSATASTVTRPLKRKPVKNRPQSTSKISPTTEPTISQVEDDSEISESVTTVASATTTDTAATSPVTTRKRKPVFDYVKGNLTVKQARFTID